MIFAAFTRQHADGGKKQVDFLRFPDVDAFVDWYQKQGDKLLYSLGKGSRALTQNGWVKRAGSPAQLLQATDTSLKIITSIEKLVSDEGIIFEQVKHSSQSIVDCMALKCEIKPID